MSHKLAFGALLAAVALYWGVASVGASWSLSHGLNAVLAVGLSAFLGWLIRDCDDE